MPGRGLQGSKGRKTRMSDRQPRGSGVNILRSRRTRDPQRTCIGCRQVKARKDLIRIARSPVEDIITVDLHGKEKGRGTYVCPNMDCINRAMRPESLSKAFRIIPDSANRIRLETIEELKQNLLELI